jgi:hypothetical protein
MTQQQIDLEVSRVTGEDLSEVRHLGFSIADPDEVCFDPEPDDLPPQVVDWDAPRNSGATQSFYDVA